MIDASGLRKEVLAARDRMNRQQISSKSRIICDTFLALDEIKQSRNIFIYVNFRSEVETKEIISKLLSLGKQVLVPITRIQEKRLDIIAITQPEKELVPGYCGIPEPREELVATRSHDPSELDVVILPGSVFDLRGGRFGYGGGYYDRLLSQIPQTSRIALAFELQVVDKIPLQDHDEILDYIITEERIIQGR